MDESKMMIKDGIENTVSFKPIRWKIHIYIKFSSNPIRYGVVEGVSFSMIPFFADNNTFTCFRRDSKTEMIGWCEADTSFEAYKKAINMIMDEFERYGKEYPAYMTALKHIELIPEEEVQKIIAENNKRVNSGYYDIEGL